jgi:hypothetical protein
MKSKESIKSLLLFSLLVSSLFLSSQIFTRIESHSETINNTAVLWKEKDNTIENYFSPQSYFINFGGSLHTIEYNYSVRKELRESFKSVFIKDYTEASLISVENNEWQEAIKKRGLRMGLPYQMSFQEFLTLMKGSNQNFASDLKIKEIIILTSGKVLFDTTQGYYQLENQNNDFSSFSKIIDTIELSYLEYRRLEDVYSLKNQLAPEAEDYKYNNQLIPIVKISDIPVIEVVDEVDIQTVGDSTLLSYANRILGKSFIRKVIDHNGNIIYMTGYGEKALKIDDNGFFEYTAKYNENNETLTFEEGINKSINALATINNPPTNMYLSNHYSYEKNGKNIDRYEFNYSYGGYDIVLDKKENSPFVVEFNGSQLVYLKRRYKSFVNSIGVSNIWESALSFNQVINENYDVIINDYLVAKGIDDFTSIDAYIYEILQNIESIELKYYLMSNDNFDHLIPVWQLKISQTTYYINIYDGEIIQSNNEVQ